MEPKKKSQRSDIASVLKMYWQSTRQHPFLIACAILALLAGQGADLAAPVFLRNFFNTLAAGHTDATALLKLSSSLGFIALMWLLDWAAQWGQAESVQRLESSVMAKLYRQSFEYLLGHSYNFFTLNFAGSLTHKVGKFARSFEMIFDSVVTQFVPTLLFVVGAVIVLSLHNLVLGLFLAVCSLLLLAFQIYMSRLREPVRARRAEAESKLTGLLSDAITNQNTIALFTGQRREHAYFGEAVENWREATFRAWRSGSTVWNWLNLFMVAMQITILGGAIYFWQKGLLTIGDFVLIQSYLLATFNRLIGINFQLRRFYDAYADAGEMGALLEMPHEVPDAPDAHELVVSNREIQFRDVEFYFHEDTSTLSHFNLTVHGGEKLALVGPSGAGKSTVTKLLLRLFDVKGGSIEIDGQNIVQVTQESLRRTIAFVPQEPVLFHRTLIENVRYGKEDATDEEVIEAAKKAHCHEFISKLKDGYGTKVGERGIRLSGGERQRVAIARAILKNAPILVLDEATSSLDSRSEALIQDALEELMRGKTVIVIAHRLSTIMKMDRIAVMEQGKVVSEGTHDSLLAQGGLYQKLWNIQAGGFLKDSDAESEKEGAK